MSDFHTQAQSARSFRHGKNVHVSSGVIIGNDVAVGDNVVIQKGAVVRDGVTLGSNIYIGEHAVLGERLRTFFTDTGHYEHPPLVFGDHVVIRTGSVFYAGSTFGDHIETGSYVHVREHVNMGNNCSLGTFSDFQCNVMVGDNVRFHSNCFVCENTVFEGSNWIFPSVRFTNDVHPPCSRCIEGAYVEQYAVIGTGSIVFPKVRIGAHAIVGAGSIVTKEVPPNKVAFGNPAKVRGDAADIRCKTGNLDSGEPYPWEIHRPIERRTFSFSENWPPDQPDRGRREGDPT